MKEDFGEQSELQGEVGFDDAKRKIDEFKNILYVRPGRYNIVLWAKPGSNSIKSENWNHKTMNEYNDKEFHGKNISWYRLISERYDISSLPDGFNIDVDPVIEEKTPKRRFGDDWREGCIANRIVNQSVIQRIREKAWKR